MISFTLAPLSFNNSLAEIESFLLQICALNYKCDLIVVLESQDNSGMANWAKLIPQYSRKIQISLSVLLPPFKTKGTCLNAAIDNSTSEYIVRCDLDDYILPYRLTDVVSLARNLAIKPDIIYSDMISSNNGALIRYPSPALIKLASCFFNPIPAPTTILRREFLVESQIKYPPFNACEDLALSLAAVDMGARFYKLNRPSVVYTGTNRLRPPSNWYHNISIRKIRQRHDLYGLLNALTAYIIIPLFIFLLVLFSWESRLRSQRPI